MNQMGKEQARQQMLDSNIIQLQFGQTLAETKEHQGGLIQFWSDLLDSAKKHFANLGQQEQQKTFKVELDALRKRLDLATEETISLVNNDLKSLIGTMSVNDAVYAYTDQESKKKSTLEQGSTVLDLWSSVLYLLESGGKVMVLLDEITLAELREQPMGRNSAPYSVLSLHDAKIKYANVEVFRVLDNGAVKRANIIDLWKDSPSRKDVQGITFAPGHKERIVNGKFNIWRGWAVDPVQNDALAAKFIELLELLCNGDRDYMNFCLQYFAHMVQKPDVRPLCAIGISGPQGYGKSSLAEILGAMMYSQHFNPNVDMDILAGGRQGKDLEGVLLAYVDEATWGGNLTNNGHIKKAITGAEDVINEKYLPKYTVPTYKRLLFTSNNSYYYKADKDDRRLLPLAIDPNTKKPTTAFFRNFFDDQGIVKREMAQAVLYLLSNEPIDDFIPHQALQRLPIQGGDIIEQSMSSVERWLFDAIKHQRFELEEYEVDGGIILVKELRDSYFEFCQESSFDKSHTLSLRQHEQVKLLEDVFGHSAQTRSAQGKQGHAYVLNWDAMKLNFIKRFKWNLDWSSEE